MITLARVPRERPRAPRERGFRHCTEARLRPGCSAVVAHVHAFDPAVPGPRASEELDGSSCFPRFEQNASEPDRSPGRDEAFFEVGRQVGALLCGGEGEVEIADGNGHDGAVEAVPSERG